MSHIWILHVRHMNAYEWVTSHIHIILQPIKYSALCHVTYARVILHTWLSHITHMNTSCQTHEWVMSYIWMSHVTHMNTSCQTHEWVCSHLEYLHSTEAYHTSERVTSQIWMSYVIHMNVWVPPRVKAQPCVMSHIWMRHVTAHHTYKCATPHIWMHHITHVNRLCYTCEYVVSHRWMRHVTHLNGSYQTHNATIVSVSRDDEIIWLERLLFHFFEFHNYQDAHLSKPTNATYPPGHCSSHVFEIS